MSRLLSRAAGFGAVSALVMLGWHALRPLPDAPSPESSATLWTAGATLPATPMAGRHLALADADTAPDSAERVPDLATVRRRYPSLVRLAIAGDGLAPADATHAAGLELQWQRPPLPPRRPHLIALHAPNSLPFGQRFAVTGRLAGLSADSATRLTLEGPDGAKQSIEVRPADDGTAAFALSSATPAAATGPFTWTLRVTPDGETLTLGATVAAPERPRVLVLSSAPGNEIGRLQRWLAELGADFAARTRLSTERERFAAAGNAPADFAAVDASLLEKFDLVVTDEGALRTLPMTERNALDHAVRHTGLGLLVHGAPASGASRDALAPWDLRTDPRPDDAEQARVARLRLSDGREFPEPVGVLPFELIPTDDMLRLARDSQGRVLAAARRVGRGVLARTVVSETWRWPLGGHLESYAGYWSALFSALARPGLPAGGRWQVAVESPVPTVGERVTVAWHAPAGTPLPSAGIRSAANTAAAAVPLNLARDPSEPTRAIAAFWPTQPGWQTVTAGPGGGTFAFYVHTADELPGVRRQIKHDATARLLGTGPTPPAVANRTGSAPHPQAVAWFSLLVLSTGYLWWSGRRP